MGCGIRDMELGILSGEESAAESQDPRSRERRIQNPRSRVDGDGRGHGHGQIRWKREEGSSRLMGRGRERV